MRRDRRKPFEEAEAEAKNRVKHRVGHTSPALIREVYGHLIGTVGKRAAEASASLVPRQAHRARPTSHTRRRGTPPRGRCPTTDRPGPFVPNDTRPVGDLPGDAS